MMLGKRARPPIKRTTSMTEFSMDLSHTITEAAAAASAGVSGATYTPLQPFDPHNPFFSGPYTKHQQQQTAASVSRTGRRHSADFLETATFLRTCTLCKRRLIPGRDIYMYRGDSAFCSLECRQQQMNQDEKKEKRSLALKREEASSSVVSTSTGSEVVPTTAETVAAQ